MNGKFSDFCFPILKLMSDKEIKRRGDIIDEISKNISEEDKKSKIKNGRPLYQNRMDWAIVYLSYNSKLNDSNRLLKRVSHAKYQITKLGIEIAKDYEKFKEWFLKVYGKNLEDGQILQTPQENLDQSIDDLNTELKDEILSEILNRNPIFFEKLVLEIFGKIYNVKDTKLTQNGSDGGIDGIIDEDMFGFSKIYIQAKRYDKGTIGRPRIQEFIGALSDKPTKKGIFVTTSKFTKEAIEFSKNHQTYSIALVDGDKLCELMIKYKIGVQIKEIKEIYGLDIDFFENLEQNF